MKSFLQLVADDMYEAFGGDYSNVTVVFPNKRAGLFMNRYLMQHAKSKPMMAPRYMTIDDVFWELSELVVADEVHLVTLLHKVYCEVTGANEPLDRFYAWGQLLLSDFEDIDNNMVDAKVVFRNIEDLNDLTTYDYLNEEQKEAIVRFFKTLKPNELGVRSEELGVNGLTSQFYSTWSYLYEVYSEFKRRLKEEHRAYNGMKKREVIEKERPLPNLPHDGEELDSGSSAVNGQWSMVNFIIVGFAVLNETEKQLFKMLREKAKGTYFYWDYDNAYLDSDAGRFVKENMRLFPNRLEGRDCYDCMHEPGKKLTMVATATEDAGCRYVAQIVEGLKEKDTRTAIVLCNEKMLGSVLYGLASVEGLGEMNVTMGYPLQSTPIFSFVAALTDLQLHGRTKSGSWRYSTVATLLRHPYAKLLTEGEATALLTRMNKEGVRFPTTQYLRENEKTALLFADIESVEEMKEWLVDILRRMSKLKVKNEKLEVESEELGVRSEELEVEGEASGQDILAVESLYETFTLMNRLATAAVDDEEMTVAMYCRLLLTAMRSRSIPFHGEPAVGLQVMGLLETRNLDFENVVMLSVNEGQIPKIRMNNSFIPYTLREAYGMTTIERQNGLYAYYFYRLLQRARNVTMVYNTSTEGINRGEMSRFLLQLKLEKNLLFAPDVELRELSLTAGNEIKEKRNLELGVRSEELGALERICRRFDTKYDKEYSEAHGGKLMTLSPSAINEFITCPRRFFLHYVAELTTTEDMDDMDIDNATFGTLFHETMEKLYRPLVGKQLQSKTLKEMTEDDARIESAVDAAFDKHVFKTKGGRRMYNGHQLLNRNALTVYVKRQIEYDAECCPFTLLGLEYQVYTLINVDGHVVRVGGVIDRSQRQNDGRVCIVDYKTSTTPQTTKSVEDLFDGEKKNRASHILQAMYYCEVVSDGRCKMSDVRCMAGETDAVVYPQLMYVKLPADKRDEAVKIDKEEITDYRKEYGEEFRSLMVETIERMFSPETEFAATPVVSNCEYCDFKELCGR